MGASPEAGLMAWVEYLRDMGVYDLYRRADPAVALSGEVLERLQAAGSARGAEARPAAVATRVPAEVPEPRDPSAVRRAGTPPLAAVSPGRGSASPQPGAARHHFNQEPQRTREPHVGEGAAPPEAVVLPPELAAPMPKPNALESLLPMPPAVAPGERSAALERLQAEIGDCTRCPLAYAGRHTIVFGEGDPNAELMFVGEGPGADEDASGRPFVGKAGQLLNNMIGAMGLGRENVYIANIVKCRPPGNRTPEFAEATTCSQFLLRQIDIVRPKVIVALGATA
ncbi:MAG TPA: uracil-DNA glycosylase family protein, partial [Acidobacteriaceae bacterium]|nr:uracil-DNA glycosylase family protein [Acidobacteriaceae bacterium]